MSSNLDYLATNLEPLEEKVTAYLTAEKELQAAEVEAISQPLVHKQEEAAAQEFEQRPPTGSFDQHSDEVQQKLQNLRDDLAALRHDILALLPTRDEWVKVNLGYGPSRVGAFRNSASTEAEPQYELRIVH